MEPAIKPGDIMAGAPVTELRYSQFDGVPNEANMATYSQKGVAPRLDLVPKAKSLGDGIFLFSVVGGIRDEV